MDIQVSFKSLSILMTKKRLLLLVFMVHMLMEECLCNAPAIFQCCMIAIFSDFIEDIMEVFMDDFSVYGTTFDYCLNNLSKVLQRCEDINLVLNWKKCHFMVQEGVVLGHIISNKGIEVDKTKLEVIENYPQQLL